MMVAKGTWLVADIYNDDYLLGKADRVRPARGVDRQGEGPRPAPARQLRQGREGRASRSPSAPTPGVYPHGDNAKQFHYMVKYGLTPARAIRSATVRRRRAARPVAADVGRVAPGCFADLIAVAGDPLDDVRGPGDGRVRDEGRPGRQGGPWPLTRGPSLSA